MKHTKALTIITLPLLWSIYFLFELFSGRVHNSTVIVGNLVLIAAFFIVGYLIYWLSTKHKKGLSAKAFFITPLILLVLDQGSKIIIKFFYFNSYGSLFNNFISFNPIINSDGSWLNARFNTNISFLFLNILNFISLIVFLELYRYFRLKGHKTFWEDCCFIFIFIGAFCSLIDKLFYGGSLDFIGIGELFIADLKDIYINLGVLFFIISIYSQGYLSLKDDDTSFKEDLKSVLKFIIFVKDDFKKLFKIKDV